MTINTTTYWFFVRGLMREAAHWEDFPLVFEKAFPGTKVVTLDLPGNGVHWSSKSPLTVSEITELIREQAKSYRDQEISRGVKNPDCYVLAISLGGMVALEWLQKFPDDLKGGVFINISLAGITPFYQRLKPRSWMPLLNIFFTRNIKTREKKILKLTTSQFDISESHLKNRISAYQRHPATKANFVRQIIAASRFRPISNKIKTPILLLNSLGDRLVDSSCSTAIHLKWDWELKTHPTANHDLPLEDPKWVLNQIADWIVKIKAKR